MNGGSWKEPARIEATHTTQVLKDSRASTMFNSSTIRKMVDEVLRDHDLPYEPRRFFEPPESSWTWCCEFADPAVSEPYRTFEICVRWPSGSNYESVKADLTRQLMAHFKS